jgi:biotin carboxylase
VITRIAIVNRGEAAMRLIHAVRELNASSIAGAGVAPIETIALYTEVERSATFVREADDSYCLGPASARPYLDHGVLERALVETRADAAWVGWGFVAEDPAFAELCEKIGVTFIGPSADAMRKLGDKIGAKLLAEEAGVPVAPWSRGAVESLDAAKRPPAVAAGESGSSAATTSSPRRTSGRAWRPSGRSAAACCSWSGWSPARATSRCR